MSDGTGQLQPYPRVTDTDFLDQEASRRKQARILSEQIASRATWIDAKGQQWLNDRLRANNDDRRRLQLTTTQATASKMRRAIDLNGWEMAGLTDNVYDPPAPSQATTTTPIVLVPPGDRKWSFQFQEPETHEVEDELAALRSEMSAQAKSQQEVAPSVPGLDEPGRLVQVAATGTDGVDTEVHCHSERRVGTVGEGSSSSVAVVAPSAPAHRRGASQPRSVPVFTGAPSGSSTDEGGFLATPVPWPPRAGSPQGGPTAALESRKEGSDQGVDISPTPDTAPGPADKSASGIDESHSEPTIVPFEQFIAKNRSEPDR